MVKTTEGPPKAAEPLVMRAALAAAFYDELLEACETLGAIAETHGQRTLVDLFYLQAALLTGATIDAWPESRVLEILQALPSSSTWLEHVRIMDDASGDEAAPAMAARLTRKAALAAKLADAERRFDAAGGRGVELAEEIDQLRLELAGLERGGAR